MTGRDTEGRARPSNAGLFTSIDDEAVRRIVRRDRHPDPIAGEHADVESPHSSRELRTHRRASLVHHDGVLTATERIDNRPFELEQISATHALFLSA